MVVDLVRHGFPAEGEQPVRDVDVGIRQEVVADHEGELPLLDDELTLSEGNAGDFARSVYAEVVAFQEGSGEIRDSKLVSGHSPTSPLGS